MKRIEVLVIFVMVLLLFSSLSGLMASDSDGKRFLMRFPDVHKDTVVFIYGEDIWKAPLDGGAAIRLTLHDGEERFPKFSPDGSLIAFTGEYDGNADVYFSLLSKRLLSRRTPLSYLARWNRA